MSEDKYGKGVHEPYAHGGIVRLGVEDYDGRSHAGISPDEARLLGLRLIKMADEADKADSKEW